MPDAVYGAAYYATNYKDYSAQNPERKLRFYASFIEGHMAPGVPWRIHDVGCAFGSFLGALDGRWQSHGSDLSSHAIRFASENHPHATFAEGSAVAPAAHGGRFGAVTAFDVLEHVEDLDAAAASVDAQLCDKGLFVFVVPVYDGLSGPVIRLLDKDPTHVHKWARQRWVDWAARHWDLIEWRGIVRYLLPTGHYVHLVTRLARAHTPAIIVACRGPRGGGRSACRRGTTSAAPGGGPPCQAPTHE